MGCTDAPSIVALIPARAGSKRVPGKNTRRLGGLPLIQWTIRAAQASGVFASVNVCTDSVEVVACAGDVPICGRPTSSDSEPDVAWVRYVLKNYWDVPPAQFAILRPTSPFRTAATIRRAVAQFRRAPDVHSLRAVEPVRQHPGKMWWGNGPGYPLTPVCDAKRSDGTPWHSSPTQTLPACYVQNASLEIAWSYVVHNVNSISGTKILPFLTEGVEGFDINTEEDWARAVALVEAGSVVPPASGVGAKAPTTAAQ